MVINVHVVYNGQGASSNDRDEIWRPFRFHTRRDEAVNEDENRTDEPLRILQSLLNKLSPANFCKIVDKFKSLILDNPIILDQAASLLVEKAITEPLFSKWYVELLCSVSNGLAIDEIEESIPYRIRMLFAEKLVSVFDDLKSREINVQSHQISKVIGEAELLEQLNETEFKFRRKFIGVGRVIAESFTLGILSLSILNRCIENLLVSREETSVKCLCKLLTTVGKSFEFHLDDAEINQYYVAINKMLENYELTTQSRFMLLDVLEHKANVWTSRRVSNNLAIVGKLLNSLSELCAKKDDTISITSTEADFSIDTMEARIINDMWNKFTQCPRNLAEVISTFNRLDVSEKTKLVRLFIMCVTKGDIYSEDCGKLLAILVQSKSLVDSDVILGVKTVIHGYRKNSIFADQQIWIRLKEIFQPLFVEEVLFLSDLEIDKDIVKARQVETQKEKLMKKKLKNEPQEQKLSWRRGLPIVRRSEPKKPVDIESKKAESQETDEKGENES